MARTDSVYWDDETKRRAMALAEADHRSMSQEIVWLVNREFDRRARETPVECVDIAAPVSAG